MPKNNTILEDFDSIYTAIRDDRYCSLWSFVVLWMIVNREYANNKSAPSEEFTKHTKGLRLTPDEESFLQFTLGYTAASSVDALGALKKIPYTHDDTTEKTPRRYVYDMRHPGNDEKALKLDDTNPKLSVLRAIYQIRCNLIHGSKTPQGPGLLASNSDLELIEWAYKTLRRVVPSS